MRFQVELTGSLPNLGELAQQFPELSARVLGYIGKQAALALYEEHLQGQDGITVRGVGSKDGLPTGASGRRLVNFSVGRSAKSVSVTSFPLNLFEGGRKLRSGRREAAKRIVRGKLPGSLRLQNYIDDAAKLIVEEWEKEAE